MSEESNRLEVQICGERYVLKGDAAPEHLRQVAGYVERMIKQAQARNPQLSFGKASLLTALNVADEFLKLKADYDNMVKLLEPRESK
ncbi:MAG: cell division protein ZapA [Peptococcaceae bacterium]|jgi:cell division protein ZapA|nr:cell division protein ZapA [Peptococcaceae bacterium]